MKQDLQMQFLCTYIYMHVFVYKIPAINDVAKQFPAPFSYSDHSQHRLQNAVSEGITLEWILTLLPSIRWSIAPVNWDEFFHRQWHLEQSLTQPAAMMYCHSAAAAKTPEAGIALEKVAVPGYVLLFFF